MKHSASVLFLAIFFVSAIPTESIHLPNESTLEIKVHSATGRNSSKLRLKNGLEALVISDPHSERAGAALAVHIGSWQDPPHAPGMAHFVEHLLFLGTEAYPDEGEYSRYLVDHGGTRNAYTAADRTVYFFTVQSDGFWGALDRFSHFFIDPLFDPSGVARESQAVHQEYCKNLAHDGWRLLHVKKALADPLHPFHTFDIGNASTLSLLSREQVRDWACEHYHAGIMHLVVVGPDPIEQLEQGVIDLFSQVPSTVSDLSQPYLALRHRGEGHRLWVAPTQSLHNMILSWNYQAPSLYERPDLFASYLLGAEGDGSLAACLKKTGWVSSVSTSIQEIGGQEKEFSLCCEITKAGWDHRKEIENMVFAFLSAARSQPVPSYIREEIVQQARLAYMFPTSKDVCDQLPTYAAALIDEPLATFPDYTILPHCSDLHEVNVFFDRLRPDRCMITCVVNPEEGGYVPDQKEPWMDVSYRIEPIDLEQLLEWQHAAPYATAHWPEHNPYIAYAFDRPTSTSQSQPLPTLFSDRQGSCFFLADHEFGIPHLFWKLRLRTPAICPGKAKGQVLADLFCYAMEEQLSQDLFQASLAGFTHRLASCSEGLEWTLSGWSPSAPLLIERIWNTVLHASLSSMEFDRYKELAHRYYENLQKKSLLFSAQELMSGLIYREHIASKDKALAIESLTYEDWLLFAQELRTCHWLEGILYGHLEESEGQRLWHTLCKASDAQPYPEGSHQKKSVAAIPYSTHCNQTSILPGHVLFLVADCGSFSFTNLAAMEVISKGIEEPIFSTLRTQEQLAYLVHSWSEEKERRLYSFFVIQSSDRSPTCLLGRYDALVAQLAPQISSLLSEERFEQIRASLIEENKHPYDSFEEKGLWLHQLAYSYDEDFEWHQKKIAALQTLSYSEFLIWVKDFMKSIQLNRLAVSVEAEHQEGKSLTPTAKEAVRAQLLYQN